MTKSNLGPASAQVRRDEAVLCQHAAGYPEVREDAPWGHRAFKVKGKTFLFLVADADGLSLSTKLPESGSMALTLPFAEPTAYGLGKSGWVSARFDPKAKVPLDLLCEWIDESYRAIAPKRVLALLTAAAPSASGTRAAAPKGKATAKRKPSAKPKPTVKRRAKAKR
jgi:predicted DNA-binding protein (MmcQ/YjbR family)